MLLGCGMVVPTLAASGARQTDVLLSLHSPQVSRPHSSCRPHLRSCQPWARPASRAHILVLGGAQSILLLLGICNLPQPAWCIVLKLCTSTPQVGREEGAEWGRYQGPLSLAGELSKKNNNSLLGLIRAKSLRFQAGDRIVIKNTLLIKKCGVEMCSKTKATSEHRTGPQWRCFLSVLEEVVGQRLLFGIPWRSFWHKTGWKTIPGLLAVLVTFSLLG